MHTAPLSVKEAARRAGVCEGLVRKWIAAGMLPHSRPGAPGKRGKILIAVEDLDTLLASFKVTGPAPSATPKPAKPVKLRHLHLPS